MEHANSLDTQAVSHALRHTCEFWLTSRLRNWQTGSAPGYTVNNQGVEALNGDVKKVPIDIKQTLKVSIHCVKMSLRLFFLSLSRTTADDTHTLPLGSNNIQAHGIPTTTRGNVHLYASAVMR